MFYYKDKMAKLSITIIALSLALVALAFALGLSLGYDRGFDACIQENNLYERYQEYYAR